MLMLRGNLFIRMIHFTLLRDYNCPLLYWLGDDKPTWLDDEQLQALLSDAEKVVAERSDPQGIQSYKIQKKIDKVIRQAEKYRRNKPSQSREVNKFRCVLKLLGLPCNASNQGSLFQLRYRDFPLIGVGVVAPSICPQRERTTLKCHILYVLVLFKQGLWSWIKTHEQYFIKTNAREFN